MYLFIFFMTSQPTPALTLPPKQGLQEALLRENRGLTKHLIPVARPSNFWPGNLGGVDWLVIHETRWNVYFSQTPYHPSPILEAFVIHTAVPPFACEKIHLCSFWGTCSKFPNRSAPIVIMMPNSTLIRLLQDLMYRCQGQGHITHITSDWCSK